MLAAFLLVSSAAAKAVEAEAADRRGLAARADAECYIPLKAVYDAMNGPKWGNGGRSWLNPGIKCCDKDYISCKDGLIDKIQFKWIPYVRGTIPPQLALLRDLTELELRNKDLTGTLPDTLFSSDSVFEEAIRTFPRSLPSPPPPLRLRHVRAHPHNASQANNKLIISRY